MVDLQLEGEGAQRVEVEGTGTGSREGTRPAGKAKATPKKLVYDDSEAEGSNSSETKGLSEKFSNGCSKTSRTRDRANSSRKSQRSLSRGKTSAHLKMSERLENISKAKLPRNIKVYKGSKDPEDHLGIFSAAAEQEECSMPMWCKMFRQTLSGAAQNWFDDLDPKSVDSFEELSQKFLEEFSKQNSGIKETSVVDGSEVKRESEEGAVQASSEGSWGHVLPTQEETRSHPSVAHLVKDIRQGNQRNRSQRRGNVKVINMVGTIECFRVRRIYVDGGSSSKIMYEHCFKCFDANTKSTLRKSSAPLVRFSSEIYHLLGLIDLKVTMGEPRKNKTVLL
uniref:Reverse transcriptase domain-containing protein n=1 Tax=Tanacetum cinerariifolium TaxID=118510 RepID=A0A6L2LQI6_TANCI|nr:reverse transcriptase domain-containing protein [Tanacetum cinerariifolium]